MSEEGGIESINAVTLLVGDMERSVAFYESLGFERAYGGPENDFTSFRMGPQALNLMHTEGREIAHWGRIIFYVEDVDGMYRRVVSTGHRPGAAPQDASWGERYFHLDDPDGHQLSFARPI